MHKENRVNETPSDKTNRAFSPRFFTFYIVTIYPILHTL